MNVENIVTYDIETLKGMFLCSILDEDDNWIEYGVWKGHNSLDKLYKYYELLRADNYYMVGFNNLNYDAQVVEYILRNNKDWWNKTEEEICSLVYQKSQNIINDNNHGLFPPYREYELFVKQIDLFKIAHYDNENKRTSLKWLEFMMDMPSIEDMPIHFTRNKFTEEEIETIKHYCRNDILSTVRFYQYLRGDIEHEEYKERDKIQDRIDLINELSLSEEMINFSDVKIGDELNKIGYCKATGKSIQNLYELKRTRRATKKFTFGDCIPEYVKFSTEPFIKFYSSIKKERVHLIGDKQEFKFECNGTTYTIARGGIHSNESYRITVPEDDELLVDADIGSQYPNAIAKRDMFPSHLGIAWNRVYKETIIRRLEYKRRYNETKEKKYKGLAEMYKLALNGGGFGKTNERTNWQYDPFVQYRCTIGNEFEILLLIEMLESERIHCVSANTDGITCLFKRNLEKKYYEICEEWEKIVGNSVNGKLEYQEYTKLVQESVNSYYAVKPDGKVKIKGRLDWEVELHKNNSKDISRIERKALFNFFTKDTPIEETIRNENNIFMFCTGVKANKTFRFEAIDNESHEVIKYNRIIRYIITNKGSKLLKVKNEDAETNAVKVSRIAEGFLVTICNQIEDEKTSRELFSKINYNYYISKACEARDFILRHGKKAKPIDVNQLNMFK